MKHSAVLSCMQRANKFMDFATNVNTGVRLAVLDKSCTKALLFELGAAMPSACVCLRMRACGCAYVCACACKTA